MKLIFILIIFVQILDITFSQLLFHGTCPKYETQSNFDLKKYLGKWYEIEKYFNLLEAGGSCIASKLVTQKDGTTTITESITRPLYAPCFSQFEFNLTPHLNLLNRFFRTGQRLSRTGIIRELSGGKNSTGNLGVSYSTIAIPFMNYQQYQVLSTDYINYSIVSSCTNLRVFSLRRLWILSREKIPSDEVRGEIYAQLHRFGINSKYLRKSRQENCASQHDLPNYL